MPVANKPLSFKKIKLSDIKLSEFNTRKLGDNDPAIKSLSDSMEQNGQLVPVIARQLTDGKYELLAGARRITAAKLLGWGAVNVEIVDVDDQQALVIITTENLQREDLTPFEEAEALKLLLDKNPDVKAAASNLGRSPQWVARRAKLLDLIPEWREAAKDEFEDWSVGHFELIARYDETMQKALLSNLQRGFNDDITFDELECKLNEEMRLVKIAPWDIDDETLIPEVGSCTSCAKRSCRQPELFEDDLTEKKIKANDKCLDYDCWKKKTEVYVERMIAKHKEKHPDIIQINTDRRYMDDSDILNPGEYENALKKDPDSKPAIVVAGPGIGEKRWIKLLVTNMQSKTVARKMDKDGKSVPPSIKERLGKLQNRRNAHIVDQLRRVLNSKTSFIHTDDFTTVASLAVVFGTDTNKSYYDKDRWSKFDNLLSKDHKDIILQLWHDVIGVFVSRLNFSTGDEATTRIPEVKRICELIGIEFKDLETQASEAIPVPKVLATQIATEKKKGATKETKTKNDPEWNSDCEEALKRSLRHFSDHEKRWAMRRETGLTNDELKAAIIEEYNIEGWSGGPSGSLEEHHKGGKNFFIEITLKSGGKLKLKGKGLILKAREIMEIPFPDDPAIHTGVCRVCGCTDDHACEGGCYWIEPDLCSACAKKSKEPKSTAKDKPVRTLKTVAIDLEEALHDLELRSNRFIAPEAFKTGNKIKVIFDTSTPGDDSLLLTKFQADKYLDWLNAGNIGTYKDMK